ncbi:MAG: enoyl-CoA hydratase/isomerase family protein [Dehalococcoidia bacterium]|nr:enoyl-CoA hydratase/isomerase family protein [Dehalococcoidia bacterium]
MEYRDIVFEPGEVARVILNRPRYHNSQPPRMVEEMDDAFERAVRAPETRVVVLSGAGPSFSAGHDLGTAEAAADWVERGATDDSESKYRRWRAYWYEASMRWRNLPIPTIAMVHGYCIYGGWIFASSMDFIFAADNALFLPSHTQYFTAPWDLGVRRAKEILYENRFITAREAYEYGFVNRIYAPEDLERETLAYAQRVAENPRFGLQQVKFSVNNCQDVQGFTAYSDSAYQTYFLKYLTYDDPLRGPDGERRARGVAQAKELLKRGIPPRD